MDDDDEGPALEPHWPRPTPRRSRCLCHSTDLRSVERRACARLTERGQAIREWKPKRPLDVTGGRGGTQLSVSETGEVDVPFDFHLPPLVVHSVRRAYESVRSAGLDDRREGTERAGAGGGHEGEEGVAGQEREAPSGVYCTAAHVSLPTAG